MLRQRIRVVGLAAMTGVITLGVACTPSRHAAFAPVSSQVKERTGHDVKWRHHAIDDPAYAQSIRDRLAQDLTVTIAVEIALVNNRQLQAEFEGVGIALADVASASVLSNPEDDVALRIPGNAIDIDAVQDVLDLVKVPKRRAIAAAELEVARGQAVAAVIDLAAEVGIAFYRTQADAQTLELRRTVRAAAAAGFELAMRLSEAGNIPDLELSRERVLFEEARLELSRTETLVKESREHLNGLLGLTGEDTKWRVDSRLPELPKTAMELADIEAVAVTSNTDLSNERWRMRAAAGRVGLARFEAWFPRLGAGVSAERESDGEWSVGPAVTLSIPLFDRKQGARDRGHAEIRRAQHRYAAIAIKVRADSRAARSRLEATRQRAVFLRDELLPLRERVVMQTLRQYNAMNATPFEVLQAKRQQITTAVDYIEALYEFWEAMAHIEQIRAGRMRHSERAMGGE